MLYASVDLEGVTRTPRVFDGRRFARQRMDRQVAVQVLENLEPRAGRVVSQQGGEMFEACSNPARRRPRQIQACFVLDPGQLET